MIRELLAQNSSIQSEVYGVQNLLSEFSDYLGAAGLNAESLPVLAQQLRDIFYL